MEEKFSMLYNEYFRGIRAYIFKRVKQFEVASDIAQDVFMKLYLAMSNGGYEEMGYFKTFLFTVAHNESMNYLGSKNYTTMILNVNTEFWFGTLDRLDIHKEYCSKEKLIQVQEIVSTLSKENIEAFNLRYFENLKFKEIAEIQKIPIGTLKSRLNSIDKVLKRKGFDFVKNKKPNQAKLRLERNRKKKLLRNIA